MRIDFALEEAERQVVLMAMAHLAVERPGWDDLLSRIAQRIDNPGPELYTKFKELHVASLADSDITARLKADAPDLLDALKGLINVANEIVAGYVNVEARWIPGWLVDLRDTAKTAKAAIAATEGRS